MLGHGFGTDQTAWSSVRDWLDERYRVVSFNMSGAGANSEANYDPRRYGSLYGYADDLVEVIGELDLEQIIYIGHSAGCMIGAAAAVARPDAFSKLMMIAGSPRYLNDEGYVGGFEQFQLDALFDSMAANFQAWAAGFVPGVVGVQDNAAIEEFSRTLFLMRPDIAQMACRVIFQSDMREVATRLERPTHVIQTQNDMAVPMEVAHWLHKTIDRSTLDIIKAEGHVPHMTAPGEIVRMFERYLQPATASV